MARVKVYWRYWKLRARGRDRFERALLLGLDAPVEEIERLGPRLSRWRSLSMGREDAESLRKRLRSHPSWVVPWSVDTVRFGSDVEPCATGERPFDLYDQSYLCGREHGGVGVKAAWSLVGGTGLPAPGRPLSIALFDVGFGRPGTTDLSDGVTFVGKDQGSLERKSHGRAMLGILAAAGKEGGLRGLAFAADVRAYSVGRDGVLETEDGTRRDVFAVLTSLAAELAPGSVVVLPLWLSVGPGEQHLPIEAIAPGRRAIRALTRRGIHVVQSAGNGDQNLDRPLGWWRRGSSIVVGAGLPEVAVKVRRSNWGRRVDLHAWGRDVTTLTLDDAGHEMKSQVGQTSAATAIVGGVVAVLSGALQVAEGAAASRYRRPEHLKRLLKRTSYWRVPGLGGRPDLEAAVARLSRKGVRFQDADGLAVPTRRWAGMERWWEEVVDD